VQAEALHVGARGDYLDLVVDENPGGSASMPTTSTSRGVSPGLGVGSSGTRASTIAATRANLDIVTLSIVKVSGGAARLLIARASRRCNAGGAV